MIDCFTPVCRRQTTSCITHGPQPVVGDVHIVEANFGQLSGEHIEGIDERGKSFRLFLFLRLSLSRWCAGYDSHDGYHNQSERA